ncbi:MAG TPA: GNAT family N-acetyltransferase [Actinomycetales bacterium]|nr:GNAT family N-acetyltransferase [Actinomycetales bacterium]
MPQRDLLLTRPRELERTLPGVFRLDRFLAANFAHRQVDLLVRRGRAVLVRVVRPRGLGLIGVGDIGEVLGLLERNAERIGEVGHALLPFGMEETWPGRVGDALGLEVAPPWEWMFCSSPPPHQDGEEHCRILGTEDMAEVATLLKDANPIAVASPDDEGLVWWGYRDEDGVLLSACAVEFQESETTHSPSVEGFRGPGVHLSGFGTHPDARGRGIGTAMMAAMTRWGVREHGYVHYGVWADNESAIRIYRRLGYQTGADIQMYRRPQ